jgi:hypothetical protein
MAVITNDGPVGIRDRVRLVLAVILSAVTATARPAVNHLIDHGYTIAGLGCVDVAAFTHSMFTGFLVTGIMFLVFEWKVSELHDHVHRAYGQRH